MKKLVILFSLKYLSMLAIVLLCIVGFKLDMNPVKETHRLDAGVSHLAINSKEDAIEFLLTKFPASELIMLKKKIYENGYSEEVKFILMSRLSPQEYSALEKFILSEFKKKKK